LAADLERSAHHCTWYWSCFTHLPYSKPVSPRSGLILSSHLLLSLPSTRFPSSFQHQNSVCIFHRSQPHLQPDIASYVDCCNSTKMNCASVTKHLVTHRGNSWIQQFCVQKRLLYVFPPKQETKFQTSTCRPTKFVGIWVSHSGEISYCVVLRHGTVQACRWLPGKHWV
jgi:hypothetical protein